MINWYVGRFNVRASPCGELVGAEHTEQLQPFAGLVVRGLAPAAADLVGSDPGFAVHRQPAASRMHEGLAVGAPDRDPVPGP